MSMRANSPSAQSALMWRSSMPPSKQIWRPHYEDSSDDFRQWRSRNRSERRPCRAFRAQGLAVSGCQGTPATALAKSVARLEDGSPASPVGELIDVIVKEVEAANQSNSQGATDTDVLAEEGQAKEGAWELFTG